MFPKVFGVKQKSIRYPKPEKSSFLYFEQKASYFPITGILKIFLGKHKYIQSPKHTKSELQYYEKLARNTNHFQIQGYRVNENLCNLCNLCFSSDVAVTSPNHNQKSRHCVKSVQLQSFFLVRIFLHSD